MRERYHHLTQASGSCFIGTIELGPVNLSSRFYSVDSEAADASGCRVVQMIDALSL